MHTQGVDPGNYADFLLDLTGGPDPVQDLYGLIPDPYGDFALDAFFFKNLTLKNVLLETVRCCGSRCAVSDGIYIKQVFDELEEILPRLVDLFNRIVATCILSRGRVLSSSLSLSALTHPSRPIIAL